MNIRFERILKTIVTGNGSECVGHQWLTKKLGVHVFFTDPYSAWQEGVVEHANKLIRQYISKNANFDNITQEELQKYCNLINNRPRKKLMFKTPQTCFFYNLP